MNQNRYCKNCNSSLCDMDPHTICKSCRQPDPQLFYCSEECEACNVIKVFEPLDKYLRKQELENLQKKLNQFTSPQAKSERSSIKKKSSSCIPVNNSFQDQNVENKIQVPDFNSEFFSSMLKGMERERSDNNSFTKLEKFNLGMSGHNKLENMKELEKRLYDRIMSSLMSSFNDRNDISESLQSKSNQPETLNSSFSNKKFPSPSPSTSTKKIIELDKDERDLVNIMNNFLEEYFPESFSKVNKGGTDEKNEVTFKISSRACDILLKGTILSSPLQASKLQNELKLESGTLHWPLNLNAADVLHSNCYKVPNMKVHPKIRQMHSILFGKLNPSLPSELLGENFTLPDISLELKNEFFFAREQLQRLLLIFSLLDYFSNENIVVENCSLTILFELILNHLKLCMEKQANFVGLLVQEIRRDLLSDADCIIPDAVSKLIMGTIHQTQFFGPYVKELREIIEKHGSSYCLTSKSEKSKVKLFKLPSKFKEGDSIENFLINLNVFFEDNSTKEKDKIAILENLLPETVIERLTNFIKPNKICETSFEELVPILKRTESSISSNILKDRLSLMKTRQQKQESVKEFADKLEKLITNCMYGLSSREILRDQFVFGLYENGIQQYLSNKFSWCFEECLAYAIEQEGNNGNKNSFKINLSEYKSGDSKNSPKRKREEKETEHIKRPKILEVKENYFYYKSNTKKNKIINVQNLQQWNHYFGFDEKNSYEVYCPWTGKILRS